MVKHPGCKSLRHMMLEEKASSKKYRSFGWRGPARDEMRHYKYIMRIYKKKCKGR